MWRNALIFRIWLALPIAACAPEPTVGRIPASDLYTGCLNGSLDEAGRMPADAAETCKALVDGMVEGANG